MEMHLSADICSLDLEKCCHKLGDRRDSCIDANRYVLGSSDGGKKENFCDVVISFGNIVSSINLVFSDKLLKKADFSSTAGVNMARFKFLQGLNSLKDQICTKPESPETNF